MDIWYYINQLNAKMPGMSEKKKERLIADLNDYNFLEKNKSERKLKKIITKYSKK